jgi:hypothetical protein
MNTIAMASVWPTRAISLTMSLVVTMQGANQVKTIELPDISPRVWGLMIQLDELPRSKALNRVSKISDLMVIAEHFHRRRFGHGLVVSGLLVSKVFKNFTKMLRSNPLFVVQRIGKLIDLALVCDRIWLNGYGSHDAILGFFRQALALPQEGEKQYSGVIYITGESS